MQKIIAIASWKVSLLNTRYISWNTLQDILQVICHCKCILGEKNRNFSRRFLTISINCNRCLIMVIKKSSLVGWLFLLFKRHEIYIIFFLRDAEFYNIYILKWCLLHFLFFMYGFIVFVKGIVIKYTKRNNFYSRKSFAYLTNTTQGTQSNFS